MGILTNKIKSNVIKSGNGASHNFLSFVTSKDISILRGKPAVSRIIGEAALRSGKKLLRQADMEWIYFGLKGEEHYFFKNEQLVYWKPIPYLCDMKSGMKNS